MSDARLTNQKVLLAEGGSKPRTAQEIRAHRARERKKFENWDVQAAQRMADSRHVDTGAIT